MTLHAALVAPVQSRTGSRITQAFRDCAALRELDGEARSSAEALARCVSPYGDDGAIAALRQLDAGAWEELVGYALAHPVRLGSAAYVALRTNGLIECVPRDACARLAGAYESARQASAAGQRDLREILDAFEQAAVPVAVLKGPYLAAHAYPDPAMRTMSDFDLLVAPEALVDAERILLEIGYGPEAPWRQNIKAMCTTSEALAPFHKEGATQVDLHWNIADPRSPFSIDVALLWQRVIPTRLGGRRALTLSPEDFLLHLVVHAGYAHGFEAPLRCYADIAALVSRHAGRFEWSAFVSRAHEWHAARFAYAVLSLTVAVFGLPLPGDVLSSLSSRNIDVAIVAPLVDHCVRASPPGSRAWLSTRRVIEAWLRDVAGAWPRPGW